MNKMTLLEKEITKYVKEIEDILICSAKQKNIIAEEITTLIYEYAEENGISDIEEIYERFGTPEEIAKQYLADVDPKKIKRSLNITRGITVVMLVIIIIISCMIGFKKFEKLKHTQSYCKAYSAIEESWLSDEQLTSDMRIRY